MTTATREYPRIVVKLADSNHARHRTIAKIDEALSLSNHRDVYGVTEMQNILLDLRTLAQGVDESEQQSD